MFSAKPKRSKRSISCKVANAREGGGTNKMCLQRSVCFVRTLACACASASEEERDGWVGGGGRDSARRQEKNSDRERHTGEVGGGAGGAY